jgi:ribosomal protein L12E/L44/L45/RPP1/RPP2
MMIESTFVTLGVLAWIFFQVAREGTERQRLLDLAEARGVPLDEARAARAVAAGQGGRLEQRLRDQGSAVAPQDSQKDRTVVPP